MRIAIPSVLLLLMLEIGCGRASLPPARPNPAGTRVAEIVRPYLSTKEGVIFTRQKDATNLVHMSTDQRVATIKLLREKAGPSVKLLFFEITRSGDFIPLDESDRIDAQLVACAFTTVEIERVKDEIREWVAPDRALPEEVRKHMEAAGGKPPDIAGSSGSSGGLSSMLNGSMFDLNAVTYYDHLKKDGQEAYRAACCLILSPTGK